MMAAGMMAAAMTAEARATTIEQKRHNGTLYSIIELAPREVAMRKSLVALCWLTLAAPVMALDINDATVEQLVASGFSTTDAQTIYDAIHPTVDTVSPVTSSKQLLALPGITQGDLNRVRSQLTVNGQRITTRSGTAPAIPGVSPAIPAKKAAIPTATTEQSVPSGSNADSKRGGNGKSDSNKGGGGGNKGGNGKGNS